MGVLGIGVGNNLGRIKSGGQKRCASLSKPGVWCQLWPKGKIGYVAGGSCGLVGKAGPG